MFDERFTEEGTRKNLPNTRFVSIDRVLDLPEESFDYVVGTLILSHGAVREDLRAIFRLLKPGGMLLFFEPRVMRSNDWMQAASKQRFVEIQLIPYDILSGGLPAL